MALTIDRLTDRARQDQVESLEREYFDWVNSELGSEFGIALDADSMIANDLAELEIYLPPDGAVLLASDDGQLAAMVFLTRLRPDAAQIRRMYVRPAYRRNGLGGALFGQAVDLARTIGYSRLLLESPRSWAGAHAVYTRHGFAPVDAYPESEVPPRPQAVLDPHGPGPVADRVKAELLVSRL